MLRSVQRASRTLTAEIASFEACFTKSSTCIAAPALARVRSHSTAILNDRLPEASPPAFELTPKKLEMNATPLSPVPADAKPQLVLVATGVHKNGVLKGLTEMLMERGASVMGAQRCAVAGVFTAMLSVYVPPRRATGTGISPDAFKNYIENLSGIDPRLKGFNVSVMPLKDDGVADIRELEPPVKRRLRVEAPQMPGLLNSLSLVFFEYNCAIDSLFADVKLRDKKPLFYARGEIEVPAHVDVDAVFEKLAVWAVAKAAKVTFEEVK